jgi:hypothetical protein
MARALRIGNCSGFYGDRFAAMHEMLEGGPLDVLTGDYLAELTMLLLWRTRLKDPARGYAASFVRQLEESLRLAWERGVRIVVNAGGLNPAGCADEVRRLAASQGLKIDVAHVEGDDLTPRLEDLRAAGVDLPAHVLTANTYLGGWGIAAALASGAQVVVTGRVTDAALVIGPAAWWHDWARDDWDRLAGALVAGHVLECGAQATGGNYAFFTEVPGLEHVGFPVAEVEADGSAVITKHPGTGGLVDVGTVTAQLLYEIGPPDYANPDVTADFRSIELSADGPDRVRISGVRAAAPQVRAKVSVNVIGGFRNSMTFLLTGLDVEAKADLVRRQLDPGFADIESVEWTLARTDIADPPTNEQAATRLTVTAKDPDGKRIGRAFSAAAVEIALASYPGCTLTAPPSDATPYGVFRAAWLPNDLVEHRAVLGDGAVISIEPTPAPSRWSAAASSPDALPLDPPARIRRVPLGTLAGARSGDKGGDANIGVWVRSEAAYRWLSAYLTVDRVRELLPETAGLDIDRWLLPNLRAVNVVIHGLLGDGVAAGTRQDPQAKGLGEWLRARLVDVPLPLLREQA